MSKRILITGASSGIGESITRDFARRGYTLGLAARRVDQLNEMKAELESEFPGCSIHTASLDVTDCDAVFRVVGELRDAMGGLDIAIANAGIGNPTHVGKGDFATIQRVLQTNVMGAIATIEAAAEICIEQGHGQLVGISSVAAYRGLPNGGAYCASKAALAVYMESARAELRSKGIQVTTIYPGFIDSPINRELPQRPFVIPMEKGGPLIAEAILDGVDSAKIPKLPWSMVSHLMRAAPTRLISKVG